MRTGRRRKTDRDGFDLDRLRRRAMFADEACEHLFAARGCLQKGAGWKDDTRSSHRDDGQRALDHEFAVTRQPRDAVRVCNARERGCLARIERTGSAQIYIEAGVRRGDVNVRGLLRILHRFGDGPSGLQRAGHLVGEHRTMVDGDDLMRIECRKADAENIMRAAPCMKHRARRRPCRYARRSCR